MDELAYELGAIDRSLPFPVLKARSRINDLGKAANDDPQFSVRIRQGLPGCPSTRAARGDVLRVPGRSPDA